MKKCVRSFIEVRHMFVYIIFEYIYVYFYYGYTTNILEMDKEGDQTNEPKKKKNKKIDDYEQVLTSKT